MGNLKNGGIQDYLREVEEVCEKLPPEVSIRMVLAGVITGMDVSAKNQKDIKEVKKDVLKLSAVVGVLAVLLLLHHTGIFDLQKLFELMLEVLA